jgi:hypothetical protein
MYIDDYNIQSFANGSVLGPGLNTGSSVPEADAMSTALRRQGTCLNFKVI